MKKIIFFSSLIFVLFSCSRTQNTVSVDSLESLVTTLSQDLQEIQTALPLYKTLERDTMAADLFLREKDEKGYENKKALLEEALALDGVSDAVRSMLQKELDSLVPPPSPVATKPKSAFQAVSMPKQLPKSKSRYSVNMGEMMKTINDAGVTEDPFKQ